MCGWRNGARGTSWTTSVRALGRRRSGWRPKPSATHRRRSAKAHWWTARHHGRAAHHIRRWSTPERSHMRRGRQKGAAHWAHGAHWRWAHHRPEKMGVVPPHAVPMFTPTHMLPAPALRVVRQVAVAVVAVVFAHCARKKGPVRAARRHTSGVAQPSSRAPACAQNYFSSCFFFERPLAGKELPAIVGAVGTCGGVPYRVNNNRVASHQHGVYGTSGDR